MHSVLHEALAWFSILQTAISLTGVNGGDEQSQVLTDVCRFSTHTLFSICYHFMDGKCYYVSFLSLPDCWSVCSDCPRTCSDCSRKTDTFLQGRFLIAKSFRNIPGRATAQAVCRLLHTEAASVRAQVRSYGICGGKNGTGAGFLGVLRFPLPILIPSTPSHSFSIIRGW
jgi:hypothetical protein